MKSKYNYQIGSRYGIIRGSTLFKLHSLIPQYDHNIKQSPGSLVKKILALFWYIFMQIPYKPLIVHIIRYIWFKFHKVGDKIEGVGIFFTMQLIFFTHVPVLGVGFINLKSVLLKARKFSFTC